MLGKRYNQNMEVFYRIIKPGAYPLNELRKQFIFFSDDDFANIIQKAVSNGTLTKNSNNQFIYSESSQTVINFIEKTNFINTFEEIIENEGNCKISNQMRLILANTKFYERINSIPEDKYSHIKLNNELCLAMQYIYKKSFDKEINSFKFFSVKKESN